MVFRVAAVSFLNTIPLVDWLETQNGQQVELMRDLPSRLTAALREGRADVALLPVAEVLRGESGGILPVAGIACRGPVDSVKLFSKSDLPELCRIKADRGSRSSVALLQVLLAEAHGLSLPIDEVKPALNQVPDEGDGLLVIGDRCFGYEAWLRRAGEAEVRSWDLGELWWRLTGLPFLFAVWAVAPGFPARAGKEKVTDLKNLLAESIRQGRENLDQIAAREAAAGRLGHKGHATAEAIDYYFRNSLRYLIGEDELAGMDLFRRLAVKHRVLPEGPMPPIL